MAFGDTAFRVNTGKMKDLRNIIIEGKFKFPLNEKFSDEGKDIVTKLITVNNKKRLGYGGINEIKNHPWFSDINWDDLLNKKVKGDLKLEVLNTDNLNTIV